MNKDLIYNAIGPYKIISMFDYQINISICQIEAEVQCYLLIYYHFSEYIGKCSKTLL